MARQPDKGKSAIQMVCDITHKTHESIKIYAVDDFYVVEVNSGKLFSRHNASGDTPELAAKALLTILRPTTVTEKKKLDRGGVK